MKFTVKKLTICAFFIALSFILANVKIMGSVAFDSLPAFVGALILGGSYGAIIGALAHMLTATLSGFPFTLPAHLITSGMMAITVYMFSKTYKFVNKKFNPLFASICAAIVGTLLNGPIAVLVLSPILIPMMGQEALMPFAGILSLAALSNIVLSYAVHAILVRSRIAQEN